MIKLSPKAPGVQERHLHGPHGASKVGYGVNWLLIKLADGDYLHDGIDIWQVDQRVNVEPVYAVCNGLLIPFTNWSFRIQCDSIDSIFQVPHRQVWVYYTHMANQNGSVSYILPEFRSGKPSSRVSQGQLLGYQGIKGTEVVHLHLSVNTCASERCNIDPSPYFGDSLDNNNGRGQNRHGRRLLSTVRWLRIKHQSLLRVILFLNRVH